MVTVHGLFSIFLCIQFSLWRLLHLLNLCLDNLRTLEPIWTEGTMTIQVDEALEEVADNNYHVDLNQVTSLCM